MIRAARKKYLTISVLLPSVILAGCAQTPLGPTVMVMPGPGKSFDAFQTDQAGCKAYAADQVKGQADLANQQAVGAAVLTTVLGAGLGAAAGGFSGVAGQGAGLGAASGGLVGAAVGAQSSSMAQMGIQQQYDNAFSQCMYSKNDNVPGFAPRLAEAPSPGPVAAGPSPVLVRHVQTELIRLNYLNDTADGAMGPKTSAAIRDFERSHGIAVDGSPSSMLLAKLQSTPTGVGSSTTALAPKGWVTPVMAPSNSDATAPGTPPAGGAPPAAGSVPPTKTE